MSAKKPSFRAAIEVSPACLDDLPDELLFEVLARVPATSSIFPAKAAARLRPVSRRWNSIISSADYIPRFISLGEENNCPWGNGEVLFLLFSDTSKYVPLFYMLPSPCNPTVFDQPSLDLSYISDAYVVISASEDLLLLRPVPHWKKGPLVVCGCSQRDGWHFLIHRTRVGISYSSVNPKDIDVFVSERGEWKEVLLKMGILRWGILPLHGKLYWYSFDGDIVSYDPFEESFRFFPEPGPISNSEPEYRFHDCCLFAVHGSLKFLRFSSLPRIDVEEFHDLFAWELDYKEGRWSLVNKSSLRILNSYDDPDHEIYSYIKPPFALHPHGNIVYLRACEGLVFHDLSQGCSNLSKVWVKEDLYPYYGAFLLTRPWRPSSVCYSSSR